MTEVCLIVEDRADCRIWLADVARAAFPEVEVATASTLREARSWLAAQDREPGSNPRIALVDLGLPDGSGVDLVRLLARRTPPVQAVVVTIYGDDGHILEAISAGAAGYLLKDEPPATLTACLRRIDAGEPPLSPAIATRILAQFRDQPPRARDDAGLTGRETEVLILLARGMTVAEAAAALSLKPQTVASYVKTIYHKLNVSNRAEAALAAVGRGLL